MAKRKSKSRDPEAPPKSTTKYEAGSNARETPVTDPWKAFYRYSEKQAKKAKNKRKRLDLDRLPNVRLATPALGHKP